MIDIHHHGQVDAARRQPRRLGGAEDGFDVRDLFEAALFFEGLEHFTLDINGEDFSVSDAAGHHDGDHAGPRADVGNLHAGLQLQGLHEKREAFLFFPLRPFEPGDPLMAHHTGNLAAHVEFANPVGIVLPAGGVAFRHRRVFRGLPDRRRDGSFLGVGWRQGQGPQHKEQDKQGRDPSGGHLRGSVDSVRFGRGLPVGLGKDRGFRFEQHWNAVSNGVTAAARFLLADESLFVAMHARFAHRAGQANSGIFRE